MIFIEQKQKYFHYINISAIQNKFKVFYFYIGISCITYFIYFCNTIECMDMGQPADVQETSSSPSDEGTSPVSDDNINYIPTTEYEPNSAGSDNDLLTPEYPHDIPPEEYIRVLMNEYNRHQILRYVNNFNYWGDYINNVIFNMNNQEPERENEINRQALEIRNNMYYRIIQGNQLQEVIEYKYMQAREMQNIIDQGTIEGQQMNDEFNRLNRRYAQFANNIANENRRGHRILNSMNNFLNEN